MAAKINSTEIKTLWKNIWIIKYTNKTLRLHKITKKQYFQLASNFLRRKEDPFFPFYQRT